MWKAAFKANASLFHGSSKLWNGVFKARQRKRVPYILKAPNQLNLVRVHMTTTKEIGHAEPWKVPGVKLPDLWKAPKKEISAKLPLEEKLLKLKEEFSKVEKLTERIQPLYNEAKKYVYSVQSLREGLLLFGDILPSMELHLNKRPFIVPSIGIPLIPEQRSSQLAAEESGKRKPQSQIIIPLDAKIPMEQKLLKLVEELSKLEEELGKLEAMEADHPDSVPTLYDSIRRKMELLARMEPLHNEVISYERSMQSVRESFLVSLILMRFEFHLKKRSLNIPPGMMVDNKPPSTSINSLLKQEDERIQELYLKLSLIQNKVSQIQQSSDVMLWKLTSFPVVPEFYENREKLEDILVHDLHPLLESATAEYPKDIKESDSPSPKPQPGETFDVVSLLSSFGGGDLVRNNGDRVPLYPDAFKGKHVLVCCFHVPVLLGTHNFQSLVYLCHELYSTRRDDFEMVVVARISFLANDWEVFEHFFSNFPESCLAVPFEDNQRRDYICKVLGLGSRHDPFECLLLNSEGVVLTSSLIGDGGEAFPFTKDILDRNKREVRDMIKEKKVRLERILRCNDSSPDFVYRFNPAGLEKKCISQLSDEVRNKHVGLYLCSQGYFIPSLVDMYEKCREKQLEFEIVVVYLPLTFASEEYGLNHFQRKIDGLLEEHNVRSSWWCLPFNNSVSWQFLNLALHYCSGYEAYEDLTCDKVIVVGPKVDHLDVYGAHVMSNEGIDAYPFTIDAAIEMKKKQFREMTLESLFIDGVSVFRGNDGSDCRQVPQLFKGKKIMVCVDTLEHSCSDFTKFKTLVSFYNEMKSKKEMDFEMVFVEVADGSVEEADRCRIVSEMPWYICPKHGINSRNLEKLGGLCGVWIGGKGFDGLFGFGEDGQICSCYRKEMLENGVCIPTSDGRYKRGRALFSFGSTLDRDVEAMLGYDACRRPNSSIVKYPTT